MRAWTNEYKASQPVRETALKIIAQIQQKDFSAELSALFSFVRDQIRYVKDVNGIETLQSPPQTLRLRAGDCDDKALLLAALAESIGIPTRFKALGFGRGLEHVISECYIGGQWIALDATEPVNAGWSPPGVTETMVNNSALAGLNFGDIISGAATGFIGSGGNPYAAAAGAAAGAAGSGGGGGGGGGGAGPGGYPYNTFFPDQITQKDIDRWGPAGPCPRWFPGVNNSATKRCDQIAREVAATGQNVLKELTPLALPSTAQPFAQPLGQPQQFQPQQFQPQQSQPQAYAPTYPNSTAAPGTEPEEPWRKWLLPGAAGVGALLLIILLTGSKK